jgi:hypothetical protein
MYRRLLVAFLGLAPSGVVLARGGPRLPDIDLPGTSPQTAAEIAGLQQEVARLRRALETLQRDYARHVHRYAGPGGKEQRTSGPLAGAAGAEH